MGKIRFGIIGAGSIAQLTCRELVGHDDAEIVAIADRDADRAGSFAKAFGVATVHGEAQDLLEDDGIDAVYIAVPNAFHAGYARLALERGKHTLLDKPFATSLAEARTVAAAARDSVFMLGMNQRFTRQAQIARRLVERGDLGDVYHVKAYWRRRSGIPRIGSWFTHHALSGGGGLLDIGVHMLDVALYAIDNFEPRSVSGATYTKFGDRGLGDGAWGSSERDGTTFDVDDFATALIKLEGGVTVALDASWAMHQPTANAMDVELYGTEASFGAYAESLCGFAEDGYRIVQGPRVDDLPFAHQSRVQHFIDVVLGRCAPAVTTAQALAVQQILDAIYRSSATGREVHL